MYPDSTITIPIAHTHTHHPHSTVIIALYHFLSSHHSQSSHYFNTPSPSQQHHHHLNNTITIPTAPSPSQQHHHHPSPPHPPQGCSKMFKSLGGLRYHLNHHDKEAPLSCPVCHRLLQTKKRLENHVKSKHPDFTLGEVSS